MPSNGYMTRVSNCVTRSHARGYVKKSNDDPVEYDMNSGALLTLRH